MQPPHRRDVYASRHGQGRTPCPSRAGKGVLTVRGKPVKDVMTEIRCGACERLLAKGSVVRLEIKCPRCKALNHVRAENPSKSQDGQSKEFSRDASDL